MTDVVRTIIAITSTAGIHELSDVISVKGLCAELGPDFDDAPRSGAVLERGLIHDSTRARAFAMCAACFTSTSATPWEMAAVA